MMMKYFEKKMKKVFSKGKFRNYTITINKGDDVDETKFNENECDVIICYKDDFDNQLQQIAENQNQINSLNQKIIQLEEKLAKKTKSNQSSTSEVYEKLNEKVSEVKHLEKSHEKELNDLIASHKNELDKLKENHENELSSLHQKHLQDLETKDNEFNSKINQLNEELSSKDAIINDIQSKSRDEIHHQKEEHLKEINHLQENQSKMISDLKSEISKLKEDHLKEVNHLDNDNANKIIELEKSHQKEVNHLSDEIASLKLNHKDEISELKQSYIDEISELKENQFNDEYHMKISDHQKEISDIKDYLVNLRMKDHNQHERFISDLEDLGFFEKHSSKYSNILKEMKEINQKKLLKIDDEFSKILIDAPDNDNAIND